MGKRVRNKTDAASNRFYNKAKYILENYADLQKRRDELKVQLSQMLLFTHDDALYVLSGGGSPNSGSERVQSSNISNPCEKAVLGADAMQEKMNSAIGRKEQKELERIEDDLAAANMTMKLLERTDPELASVARQLYIERRKRGEIYDSGGFKVSYHMVARLSEQIIERLGDYLWTESRIRFQAMIDELDAADDEW